jgi:hypothetical protein
MNARVSIATRMRTCIQGYLEQEYLWLGLKEEELRQDGGHHAVRSPLHRTGYLVCTGDTRDEYET